MFEPNEVSDLNPDCKWGIRTCLFVLPDGRWVVWAEWKYVQRMIDRPRYFDNEESARVEYEALAVDLHAIVQSDARA